MVGAKTKAPQTEFVNLNRIYPAKMKSTQDEADWQC